MEWNDEYEKAFQKLKDICMPTPILAYADFMKMFQLLTEACILGFRTILYQNQDGINKVIRYVNRSLSKT